MLLKTLNLSFVGYKIILGKGENAGYQCFWKEFFPRSVKTRHCVEQGLSQFLRKIKGNEARLAMTLEEAFENNVKNGAKC